MAARAFCPGNVSCVFYIYRGKRAEATGSLGVGFTVNKGVHVMAGYSEEDQIFVNGKLIEFDTVKSVKDMMTKKKLIIDIKAELPFGVGFGMSGASALGSAFAINKLVGLGFDREKLGMIAHKAEVLNKTGLGDVAAQLNGGFLIKVKKGNPLAVERLDVLETNVYYKVFSALDTKKIIASKAKANAINRAGLKYIKKIKKLKGASLKDIIKLSKKFVKESKLIADKNVKDLIDTLEKNNIDASMIMLGNAVYSDQNFIGSKKIEVINKGAHYV